MPLSANTLSPAPVTTPVLGVDGKLCAPWASWFQGLTRRVGGGSTTPLDQVGTSVTAVQSAVTALQAGATADEAAIAALSARATADEARIGALETKVAPALVPWTPAFSGMTTSGTVSVQGWYRLLGGEAFWQVVIDATGGTAAFSSAQITNMPVPATLPGMLAAVNLTVLADYGHGFVAGGAAMLPNFSLSAAKALLSGRYVQ